MMLDALRGNFARVNHTITDGIFLAVEAMVKCSTSNTSEIVRELSLLNKNHFKTNDMWLYRFLAHKNFQIDDHLWRCYIKSIFQILTEHDMLNVHDKVLISIDFTSDRDDFLILCASITCGDLTIPLYFSMRNYPKRKNQYDHKKMESAFIKALQHILSDKYQYLLLADRGFCNDRFIQLCRDHGFDVLIRMEPNITIETVDRQGIMADVLCEDGVYQCQIKSWEKEAMIVRHSKDGSTWYLLTNMFITGSLEGSEVYAKRFKIEKLFQNLKSSGFDIEKSKIKKYDRFKRMLFLSCFANSILVLLGKFVHEKLPHIKKNSPTCISLLIASSSLEEKLLTSTLKKPENC